MVRTFNDTQRLPACHPAAFGFGMQHRSHREGHQRIEHHLQRSHLHHVPLAERRASITASFTSEQLHESGRDLRAAITSPGVAATAASRPQAARAGTLRRC